MRTVNIHEAKTHLSRYVEQAANGEEIINRQGGQADRQAGAAGGAK